MEDVTDVLVAITDNLNSGNIKFVVLMDKLHNRLKDLIVYINQNSHFDIYAVEAEYYRYDDFEIIISKKSSGNNYGYSNADKQAFLDDIKKHGELLSETAISAVSNILTIFEKISERYNAKLEYFKSERANRFLVNIKDIDNRWIISEYSTGEIWAARQDSEDYGLYL